ncbi:MAG: ABC transporter ATP-binding protein/permease [Sarcina sp.]
MMINKRLINTCNKSKKYIGLTTGVNLLSTICNIFTVLIIGEFINKLFSLNLLNNQGVNNIFDIKLWNSITLEIAVLMIFFLYTIRTISNILYGKFSSKASGEARFVLRDLIYKKLLKLGPAYKDIEETSAILQLTIEGIEQLEVYFGKYLSQLIYSLLIPIILFVFMSFISIKVAVIFIIAVPLIPISIIAIMKFAKKILGQYWKSYSNLGDTFLENLQGLTTLKLFNLDENRHEKMNTQAENFRKITMKVLKMQLNSITAMDLVAFLGTAIGIIVALFEFRQGKISIGGFLIIILLSAEFFIPLRLLGSYFHIAMNGMAASERLFNILDAKESSNGLYHKFEDKILKIKFENFSFSYDNSREVLRNINMNIGETGLTAIVGESGSGKSTLANLLMNNYENYKGVLSINNIEIKNLSRSCITEKIGIVSTNSYIFNGSILDNLLIGKKDAKESEIKKALKIANLTSFIDQLENGLLTNVGQSGAALSGGQKQRLALAREVLANRDIIIFDEATSNIDVESEEFIWDGIYELAKTKKIIAISHRIANVKEANEIYVMHKGTIIESGTDESLRGIKGKYFEMINIQNDLEIVREVC